MDSEIETLSRYLLLGVADRPNDRVGGSSVQAGVCPCHLSEIYRGRLKARGNVVGRSSVTRAGGMPDGSRQAAKA